MKTKPAKKGRPARALNKYTSIVHEAEQEARSTVLTLNTSENNIFVHNEVPTGYTVTTTYNNYDTIMTANTVEQYIQNTAATGITHSPSYPGPTIFSIPSPSMDSLFSAATNNSLDLFSFQAQALEDNTRHTIAAAVLPPSSSSAIDNDRCLLPPPSQEQRVKQLEMDKKQMEKTQCDDECDGCITNETGIQRLLSQLSLRANVSDNYPEMRVVTNKVKALRNVMLKNITTLEESFQQRFMSVQAHCLQLSLPVIMCCGLNIIAVNPAACELFRMKKAELLEKKFLFNLLAPGDLCIAFMKRWAEAVVDYVDLDRMRVKVEVFGGVMYECIMNATVYREPGTGCPLLETYMFVRVDDV